VEFKIKQVLLDNERIQIKLFLSRFHFEYDDDIDYSLYIEDEGKIIATISKSGYIIKCLAVDEAYKGYNLASKLVLEIIVHLKNIGINYYQVFTKIENEQIFLSLNFSLIVKSDKVCLLESPIYPIANCLNDLKKQYNITSNNNGAIVINGNPLTLGHLGLIKEASKHHKTLIVFIVETDLSDFSYEVWYLMMRNATKNIKNVVIIPSTKYIISRSTFPTYFIKEDSERSLQYAKLDVAIFKEYFLKIFNISTRYIGEETNKMMVMYNEVLKSTLKEQLVLIDRFELNGQVISASLVRSLMKQGKVAEALEMVPSVNQQIVINKYKDIK
jgi:[citrate (pro-3S)-lyase] ligase